MIDNVLYNNVGEIEKTVFGNKLHRFPREVEKHMNDRAAWMSRFNCGCEIRFVTKSKNVDITLLAEHGTPNITVLKGDYVVSRQEIKLGEITTIRLSDPKVFSQNLEDDFYKNNRFSKDVWRIWMHNGNFTVCSIDAYSEEIRKPTADEMPAKTLLTYGSSITHGAGAVFHYLCYANQLAVNLGMDVLIKGTGGSCHCEKEVCDYLAGEKWDYALLEPMINMLGEFEKDEFEKRVSYLVKVMAETKKTIFVTTMYTNAIPYNKEHPEYERHLVYDDITREICKQYGNVILIEGKEILDKTKYLSADSIHPCDYGHLMMAKNWYEKINKYVK